MPTPRTPPPLANERLRAANLRTGALLATIVVVFFIGMIVSHYLGGPAAGLAVVGIGVMLYLVLAISRTVGRRR